MMRILLTILTTLSLTSSLAQTFETILQQGHELAVISVAASPDSNYVATGSRDKSAKLWEINTGREVRSFLGHDFAVTAIAFTGDGKTLVTGSNDKTIRLWDIATGDELASILLNYRVTALAIDPTSRYAFVGGYQTEYVGRVYQWDDSVVVIDLKSKRPIKKIDANPDKGLGYGTDVAISPDGNFLAVGEDNRVARVYRTSDWSQSNKFDFTEGSCGGCGTKVAFSPDSKHLYMVSHNGPLKKYKMPEGTLEKTYIEKVEDLDGLQISPNGKVIAISTKKTAVCIDEATGKVISELTAAEKGEFHKLAFTHKGHELLVTSDDNTLHQWTMGTNKDSKKFTGILNMRDKGGLNYDPNFYWQSNIAKYVRFKNDILLSRDGKTMIKGKFGTKVKRWDVASGKTVMEYVGHKKAVLAYDLSKDGKRLVTGGGDGKIILWDLDTGDSLKTIASYREPIFDIHFNSDETKVVTSSWDATMKIHDLKTTMLEHFFEFENNSAYNVMFHPNDLYIFSSRLDNSVQMWEIDTHTAVRTFVGHKDIVSSMVMSPDQKSLLTASWDGSLRLWDIGTGLMNKKLVDHHGPAHVAIFSPDGRLAYSGGADRSIRMWDMSTSKVVKTFNGHRAEVTSLKISPDEKMLISHSVDGVTKFWDLASGKEFFEHIHFGDKDWMVKNPDGYFNGTDGAREHIHFVDGMKTYAVDQFFEEYYRPDLLPKIFQNRGGSKDDGKGGIQGKLQSSPPPSLKVAIVPSQESGKGELYVRITDEGAGVENLKVYHNGKSLAIDRTQLQLPNAKQPTTTYKLPVTLVGGNNVFSASASNKDRVEGTSPAAEYVSDHVSRNSVCYLLAVGINQYKNPRMTLTYARPDAQSFIEVMEKKATLFKNLELHTLYDQEASRGNILKKLDDLSSKIQPEDVFVFYYAGHGSMVDNQFYFIPTESLRLYDASSLKTEAIEATVLQDKLKNIRALKQLIIMDACQSGGSVELLATRGASEEKAIAQLSRSAGIHVMASAGSDQFATEFAELGHGLFTYLLLKALQGDADGAPKDGKVTIYELKSYLDDQVPEMTRKLKGKPQYPYTFSRGQDFPVVVDK
ncbi:MAG TPA: caspase family protein [Cyclobacteriaceae bacterium]|nr:caspase family protein [Cyclobacteriaceae bacterium]